MEVRKYLPLPRINLRYPSPEQVTLFILVFLVNLARKHFTFSGYVTSNGKMARIGKNLERSDLNHLKELYEHFAGGTEEKHWSQSE